LPMAYIRSSAKEHGKHRQVEGILKKGFRVLLVSDIISTEQDIPISVKAIKNAGAEIACCLTIFSNNLGVIESFLEEEKIKYHSLTDIKELLEVAGEKKLMSPTSQAVVFEWTRNPDNWNKQRQAKIGKILRKNKEKISSALLEIKAVTVDTKNPFCFASGILSPVYTDNRLLMAYPGKWKEVIDSFTSIIINKIGIQNVDVICGTSTAGIPHAAYLSEKLGLPLIYVKSKKEEYGKHTIIEGNMRRGDRVLIIEDLVSSGGSSISASSVIREAGGIVENCLAILTYGMKEATKCFEREKVELITLTDLNTLLKVAVTERYITLKEQDTILNWVDDPRSWEKNQDFDLSQTQKTPLE